MSFEAPTFEEYKRATAFAKFKYKYALIVLIGCWICFIILIFFVWNYQQELSEHPGIFAVKKLGVDHCYCYSSSLIYYINSTSISYNTNDLTNYWG